MRITRESTVCIVIDIQEKLFPVMAGKEVMLKNCRILLQGLQILQIPLIITQQYSKGLGETIADIKSEIIDFSHHEKRDFSCCGEPEVMFRLKQSGAKNVILCGIESHICVLQTALDLKEAGFVPVIIADAVTSRYLLNFKLAKERFRYEGIMMTSVESVLFELTRSSTAPEFKAISNLMK